MSLSDSYMAHSYSAVVVGASLVIAVLASYVTMGLARRVHTANPSLARVWWLSGALVMGSGIWSMHFIGMQAFQLPITLGYQGGLTLLSWAAAVLSSGVALGMAARRHYQRWHGALAALAMGGGICAMHYLGMLAVDLSIPIDWQPGWVALSVLVALVASASALGMFRVLFQLEGQRLQVFQTLAAMVMGVAVCGMHYAGMMAAEFVVGTVCLSQDALGGPELTTIIVMTISMLLMATLLTLVLDARMQSREHRLNLSLQESNSQLHTANEELRKRAFSDPLTHLPNRLLLEDRLQHALERIARANYRRTQERLCVLFVDLDGFKPINDSFGHATGDRILQGVAQRLLSVARNSDTVARVGGDEFLLLLEDIQDLTDCTLVAQRVITQLGLPFHLDDKQLQISASVGIVMYPSAGVEDSGNLISQADAAMYVAKRNGGNSYAIFQRHMGRDAAEQLNLQNDLRHAIARGQMQLHYQPKVDSKSSEIIGVEALLRWNHPTRGMISPLVFIPLAERFGQIQALGNWVIDESCRQLAVWRSEGIEMRVAINLSVHQLRESGLAQRIAQAMQSAGLSAEQLLCEITESVAMEDVQATQRTFEELRNIGVYLSIDDFGTGYSSLSYLRQLPAQQLKIDRSFIRDLENQEASRAVVQAVLNLAHALGLRVVAEGVETAAQRDILMDMGCDEFQGFFFARPMPAERISAWAAGDKPLGGAEFAARLRLVGASVGVAEVV